MKNLTLFTSSHLMMVLFLFVSFNMSAQVKEPKLFDKEIAMDQNMIINMKDGTTYNGTFQSKTDSTLTIFAGNTKIELKTYEIKSFKEIDKSRYIKGKYWFPNPHHTRYLFGPSAFNLKKGEGYYQNTYAVLNTFNYGVTDHFTLGAGTELISLFAGYPILILTPKIGGYKLSDKWYAGGGAFLGFSQDGSGGIGYGILSYGNEDSNITFGTGWAFSNSDLASNPVLTISGMHRFARSAAFITENWLVPIDGYVPVFSYGLRFFGERMAVDIAFINTPEVAKEIVIGIPFIDFVYKF